MGWEIYERTHSSLALGLVGLTAFVPQVLMTLPAGHVADTRERKRVIILMQGVLALHVAGPGVGFVAARPVAVDVYLPFRGGRGADFFLVGQRLVSAAIGGARRISPARSTGRPARFNSPP